MMTLSRLAISSGDQLLPRRASVSTLAQLLIEAAERAPESRLICLDLNGREEAMTYGELLLRSQRCLGELQAAGVGVGDRLLLQLPDGAGFFTALWACFLGGIIPVPVRITAVIEPGHPGMARLLDAWRTLDRPPILTDDATIAEGFRRVAATEAGAGMRVLTLTGRADHEPGRIHTGAPAAVALMLLTSGSTGGPKAVMLGERNLLSMSASTIQQHGFTADEVTLNWMPLDHVGALTFLHLMAVDLGCSQLHVPTEYVLRAPLRWLELSAAHRATISWAPNFAFSLINDQAPALAARPCDLSRLRFLVNGGEQVGYRTMHRFITLLQQYGLPPGALRPSFGMSETCAGITWSSGLRLTDLADEQVYLSLGRPGPGAALRITDEQHQTLAEGEIGRLQIKGPTVTCGYYGDPERTREVLDADGWFTTGDLGFIRDGELVITGREKHDIILHGVNHAAHEIEAMVEEVAGVAAAGSVAFAVREAARELEVLAVV
ncbi:MAG TPA: AMP-binding protein, partial [Nannocystis sp.]